MARRKIKYLESADLLEKYKQLSDKDKLVVLWLALDHARQKDRTKLHCILSGMGYKNDTEECNYNKWYDPKNKYVTNEKDSPLH